MPLIYQLLLLSFSALLLLSSELFAQQNQCLGGTNADITIMLDLTGSMESADIRLQKEAVRKFVDFFDEYPNRPKISLGSFNSDASHRDENDGYENEYGFYDHARIVVPGTQDYSELLEILSRPTSFPEYGRGGTNLGQALAVSAKELERFRDPQTRNILLLLSDGELTNPGWYTFPCQSSDFSCDCDPANNFAIEQAASVRANDIEIFAIHFGGENSGTYDCGEKGIQLLKNSIVTQPASKYFFRYESEGDALSKIFESIAEQIVCDDGRSCTDDVCSQGLCQFTERDSDADGQSDCYQPDCEDVDQTEELVLLDTGIREQEELVRQITRRIKASPNQEHVRESRRLLSEAEELGLLGWTATWRLPHVSSSCEDLLLCVVVDNSGVQQEYLSHSESLMTVGMEAISLLRDAAKETSKRKKRRRLRRLAKKYRKRVLRQYRSNKERLSQIETLAVDCTKRQST